MLQGERQGRIHRLRFSRDITISHLLFANDSLVLIRATTEECKHLKSIFYCYTSASGQVFNYEKSSMFFSSQIQGGQIITIKNIFELNVVSMHEKYLGLPSMIGRRKISFFNYIKLKLLRKISNWQHNFFFLVEVNKY